MGGIKIMFGLVKFGLIPFGSFGLETAILGQVWSDQCPNNAAWGNLPLENTSWEAQSGTTTEWEDQRENTIITKRCI